MKEQAQKQSVGTVLEAYATRAIPDDRDLWPTLSERLHSRQPARPQDAKTRARWCGSLPRLSLAAGAAALLVATLILAGFPPGDHRNAAAETLNNLGAVAAVQLVPQQPADLTGAVNTYRYMRSEGAHLVMVQGVQGKGDRAVVALVPRNRELWVAPDGSGRIRETVGKPVFLGERDRADWEAAGSPSLDYAINQDFGPGGLLYEDFARLPTDPNALAAAIRARADKPSGPPVDVEMFVIVGDLLREPGAPPQLRSALYEVAARIDGVELVGKVTDRAGRPGVAVAMTTDYWGAKQRFTLIFDPATSAVLAEERVLLERADWTDAEPPAVIGYTTYLESGVVTRLP